MDFLLSLLPKIQAFGSWIYPLLFIIATLESTAFIGLAVPGTTLIVFTGFLAAHNVINLGNAIWIVALGGIVGDTISFYLGRYNISFFKKENRFFKLEYLQKGERYFEIHGNKSVAFARFIGPIRPVVPFVAGLTKMRLRSFFIFNVLGGFAGAAVYVLFGYFFGTFWHEYHYWFVRFQGGLILTAIVLIVGYFVRKRFLKNTP